MRSFVIGLTRLLSLSFRKRSHLRTMIRGYAQLKRQKRMGLSRSIKSALADTRLPRIAEQASPLIFGAAVGNAERAVRQYLLQNHIGEAIFRAVLHALGRKSAVVYALPPVWRQILVEHGLKVGDTRSALAWRWSLVLHFGKNILRMGLTLLRVLAAQGQALPKNRYVYFVDLSEANLPQSDQVGRSYDLCSWYAQWEGRRRDIAAIRHNVHQAASSAAGLRIESIAAPFLLLRGKAKVLRLLAWCGAATLVAAFDLLRGRWWHAMLLVEALRAKAVALCPNDVLAADYLFHYSGTMFRPLWTYEAERKGARTICYFYSAFEQPKLETGYESQAFVWGAASWPRYLVWDAYQEEQLRRGMDDKPEIRVVGPIWFSDKPAQLELMSNSVAVFDVELFRQSMYFPVSSMSEYFVAHPDLSERFLHDVQRALAEHGLSMAFKSKREEAHRRRKKYKKLLQEIAGAPNVTFVAPAVSPLRLIEKCIGVISMPFTSPALYLRQRNIPSVYFDPTGWIQRDDRAAHGIPVLIGKDELRRWISATLLGRHN